MIADESAIIEQLVDPGDGSFSPEHARYVLSLHFTSQLQSRFLELSDKAQNSLSNDEQAELEGYLSANAFLTVLKSKARRSLEKHGTAA